MTDSTTPNAPTAREPRCVFCGKRKELREMDGVWLCPGPHEAIALDQLAALRSARDYWKGESDAATAALLAARREVEARAALHNRVVSLLLAIKHDAEWQDHLVRHQFSAYHAEATALIAELRPDVAARESEVIAAVTGAALAATQEEK